MPSARPLCFVTLLACASASPAQRATVDIVPLPPDALRAFATGLSDAGHLVSTAHYPDGSAFSFLRDPAGGLRGLEGAGGSLARGVNRHGEVAGEVGAQGVRWQRDGAAQFLPLRDARGLSDAGLVGGSVTGAKGERRAATWDALFGLRTLQEPDGAEQSVVRGVHASGAMAGYATEAGLWQPLLWRGGSMQRLGTAGFGGVAEAVNARGEAVGFLNAADGRGLAVLWTAQGQPQLLDPDGAVASGAFALNDAGQVLGVRFTAGGGSQPFLWTAQGGLRTLDHLAPAGGSFYGAAGLNRHAQVATSVRTGDRFEAALVTLHPDWRGGSGAWDDGQHWDWAGTGVAAAELGAMHRAVINPGQSLTVQGAREAEVRSLMVGGSAGQRVTLDLAGGHTQAVETMLFANGGALRGGGQLSAAQSITFQAGSRLELARGERLLLSTPQWAMDGSLQMQGAQLDGAGWTLASGRMVFNDSRAHFGGTGEARAALSNVGQLVLEASSLSAGDEGVSNIGQLAFSFGNSRLEAALLNTGLTVVSNGAQASFLAAVQNFGELRVSAGGAANFFGLVSGDGLISGSGELRFEGGLAVGDAVGSAAIEPNASLGAASTLFARLGQHLAFQGAVKLQGSPLVVEGLGDGLRAGQRFDLFDWNGVLSGQFGNVALPQLAAGLHWDLGDLYRGGSIAVVPEPPALALLGAGLLGLLGLLELRDCRAPCPRRRTTASSAC